MYEVVKIEDPVPPREMFAHIMTIVYPAPSLDEWEKTHIEMVERLEEKHEKPFRKIVKECGKERVPKFPKPPRSD